jgi:asparaginyl-tRNA synthetase
VVGTVRADARATGGHELSLEGLTVVHEGQEFPIQPKEHGVEFLFDQRHLYLRSRTPQAVLRVRHEVVQAARDFFYERGFVNIDSPILTPAACEGTTTLFSTDYFGSPAYLAQSGQLYVEPACMAFGRVYCFGPTFRAEKSKTRRHLTEFWMVEPEVAYAKLEDIMALAENFLSFIVGRVLESRKEELKHLERDVSKLEKIAPPFPRLQYDDAVKRLQEGHAKGEMEGRFEWGGDLGSPDETYLSNQFDKPVMVHRYPATVKAFYMEPDPERSELALCVDVLAPEGYGEIIGGGQRLDDLDLLLQRIKEHNLPQEAFEWYLDLRRYGTVPHAGFGMGVERVVAWICGLEHLREAIPYPRMLYRLTP